MLSVCQHSPSIADYLDIATWFVNREYVLSNSLAFLSDLSIYNGQCR